MKTRTIPQEKSELVLDRAGNTINYYVLDLTGKHQDPSVDDVQDCITDLLIWLHLERSVSEGAIQEEILRSAYANFLGDCRS